MAEQEKLDLKSLELAAFNQRRLAWEHYHSKKISNWPKEQRAVNLKAAEAHLAFILQMESQNTKAPTKRTQRLSSKKVIKMIKETMETSQNIKKETKERPTENDSIKNIEKNYRKEIEVWFNIGKTLAEKAGLPTSTFHETIESLSKLAEQRKK